MAKKTLALFGVGLMGTPYSRHLVELGVPVRLYNRTLSKAQAIEGATAFSTPAEAAEGADFVFSVLAHDQAALEEVTEEVLERTAPGAVHLSCSTISAETTLELEKRALKAGRDHLTLPFLGRPDFVEKKMHQFLLSGRSDRRQEVLDLLAPTCKSVVDFGSSPLAAIQAKLATNFMIASSLVAMGEAFAMLERADVDPAQALELWTSSLLDCPFYKNYGKKVVERDYETPFFPLYLGLKDATLIEQEAAARGVSGEIVQAVKRCFERSVAAGHSHLDWTGVTRLIRD